MKKRYWKNGNFVVVLTPNVPNDVVWSFVVRSYQPFGYDKGWHDVVTGAIKWDGCMDWHAPSVHHCDLLGLTNLYNLIDWAYTTCEDMGLIRDV